MWQPGRAVGSERSSVKQARCFVRESSGECDRGRLPEGELWYRAMIAVVALSLVATAVWI